MIVLALVGCALGPGRPFVELRGADLVAGFEPGARLDGDRVLTDAGASYHLDSFEVEVSALDLEELQGAAGVEFDPADPPDGYSLCHGGHCHAADGSLVDYSEVIAELSGGAATLVVLAGWPLDRGVDLLAGLDLSLEPPAEPLPQTTVTRAVLRLTALHLVGDVAAAGVEPVPFDLTLPGFDVGADLGFEVGLDAPAAVRLAVDWPIDGTVFDGVDVPLALADGDLAEVLAAAGTDHLALQPMSATFEEVP